MKKKYVKPQLFFESFEMNTAIASCDGKIIGSQSGVTGCRVEIVDLGITIFGKDNCDKQTQDGTWDTFCYDVAVDENKLLYS